MTIGDAVAIGTGAITAGGVLIYIGKSLGTLRTIDEGQKVLFRKAEKSEESIARIDKELVEVKTRQADCEHCP